MHIRTEISQELQAHQAGATEQMHFHENSKAIIKPLNKSHWSITSTFISSIRVYLEEKQIQEVMKG